MKGKHRIFIAINLPEKIKRNLADYKNKWPDLPARWTKPENLHITLEFIGYANDNKIPDICDAVKNTALKYQPFLIKLGKISYGPPGKIPPRMVWAIGERSPKFTALRDDLEKLLIEKISFLPEKREFSPHITLGRIRNWEWRRIEPEERPEVEEYIALSFEVNSIEVMESTLKKGGAEYAVLQSFSFE